MYNTKYHKTGQFRQAIKTLRETLTFDGFDSKGNIIRKPLENNIVYYTGTVKLHGTNANLVLHEDQSITLHSKENYLATITPTNEFEFGRDNAGFAQTMFNNVAEVRGVFNEITAAHPNLKYPIKVSGEWCGQGVQKGVGISFLAKKTLFLFDIKSGDTHLHCVLSGEEGGEIIYDMYDFPIYHLEVDLNFPDKAVVEMEELVAMVEACCPVAEELGCEGDLVGEGLVWTPDDIELYSNTGLWFKTKGQKHSASKVKKLVHICPEKMASIEEFIEYTVTENRLNQGLENVEVNVKNTGEFIKWVVNDIRQEESDTLEASGLEIKDVGKYISTRAREFFSKQL